jgi:plastocyanin
MLPIKFFSTLLAVGALTAACSNPAPPPPPPANAVPAKHVDAGTAGSIAGRITFTGPRPAVESLRMGSDPACMPNAGPNPQSDAALVSENGGMKNAFVYIKDGLDPAYGFDAPTTSVTLTQHGCKYVPHVLGVRVGQPIEILNDDATLHNVHALPLSNQEFNQAQLVKGSRMTKTFTVPEVMVRFKCDVHGWMNSYVGVMTHPFFAVTNADGAFEIKGLPPGTYTIGVWTEKFGTQTQQVTIAEHQAQTVSLAFAAH